MNGVIVNLHGPEHIARRRLENRLFRRDTFAWYEAHRTPHIIAAALDGPIAAGRGDLLAIARRTMMTLSVIIAGVDVATGAGDPNGQDPNAQHPNAQHPSDDDPAEFERFASLMERLARAAVVAHTTGDPADIIADGDAALAEFDVDFFRPSRARREALVAAVRRGELADDELPKDVLTTLLVNQDTLHLPDDVVLREVAYYPWVGSHSTSAQLVHAMHHIFEWLDEHPDDRARLIGDDLLRQRFVHESMRLHPASPVALRIATCDVELTPEITVAAGETVAIDIESANRDPAQFGDAPGRFDPGRSLAPDVAPWGLSFGHGTHSCLGQELAGGVAPDHHVDHHLLGSVAVMAGELLAAGARPAPDDPPVLDSATTRVVWGRYPVVFDPTHPADPADR